MKKLYNAPALELLQYISLSPIGAVTGDPMEDENGSKPWNDGELGWT